MSVPGKPQAGWYPDPDGKGGQRYFDGTNWGPKAPTGPVQPLTTTPKKQSGRGGKIIAVIVGIVFLLFLFGKCGSSDDKKSDNDSSESRTTSSITAAPSPTPTGPKKPNASFTTTPGPDGDEVTAKFAIGDNFTEGMIKDGARFDTIDILKYADGADVGYGSFYNHFDGLEAIAEVLATDSVRRILAATEAIMSEVRDARLLPCVGARVILRSFLHDAVVRWMVKRPFLFTDTFKRQARPFMERFEAPGIESGALKPPVDHATWIRTLPWILLSELRCAVDDPAGNPRTHEESFARICLRLLGIGDDDVDVLLTESLRLVNEAVPDDHAAPTPSQHSAVAANR